jgi:hypothetical protein
MTMLDAEKEAREVVTKFRLMTLDEWVALPPFERGFIAGLLAGNFAAHHPDRCFEMLRELYPK